MGMTVYEGKDDMWKFEVEDTALDALAKAAPVLERQMKATARASIKHDGDSEMIDSIKASKPKKTKNGAYIVNVGPRGYSMSKKYSRNGKAHPVSNALKAIWKEYGIPGRGISAQPFISSAVNQCSNEVANVLHDEFGKAMTK